jgi:hypothetical protein
MGSLDCTKYALWTINMLSPPNLVKLQYKFNLLREKSPYCNKKYWQGIRKILRYDFLELKIKGPLVFWLE